MSARKTLPAHENGSRNIFADLGLRMPRNTCYFGFIVRSLQYTLVKDTLSERSSES
jgi:hypothetical protein